MKYRFLGVCLGVLFVLPAQAQIKLQATEFQFFVHQFPILQLPFSINEKALKIAEREEYTRIERRYAEMFLDIAYERFYDTGEHAKRVAHFIGAFKAHDWQVLVYYWYPFPSTREANDNFEMVIFDSMGGKIAQYKIAGKWGEVTQFAHIAQAGKDIIITTEQAGKTTRYHLTEKADLVEK